MAHMLALDWDEHELRFVSATVKGARLKVRAAESRSLLREDSEDEGNDRSPLASAIQEVLSEQRAGRATVLVGLGRADIDMMELQLPPAKDTELPEMVANEVLRRSPQLAEDAIIDFVALNDNPEEPREVAAAICTSDKWQEFCAPCEEAGKSADRLVVRPFGLARFAKSAAEDQISALVVCRVGEEADLLVLADGHVRLARTVRLASHGDEHALWARLIGEIHRTLLIVPPRGNDQPPVDRICVVGHGAASHALAERLETETGITARVTDPLRWAEVPTRFPRDQADRFAPLMGMLLDEAAKSHLVDFLHPRRPPAPPDRRRQLALAGLVLAAIVGVLGFHVWDSLNELDMENERLAERVRELETSLKRAGRQRVLVQALEQWEASNVNWLDELRDFTLRFPSSRDAIVLHMTLTPNRNAGGEIDLNGLVRNPDIVLRMENAVRDSFHQIRSKRIQERDQDKNYAWHFESNVIIRPRTREQYVAHFLGQTPETEQTAGSRAASPTVPIAAVASEDKGPGNGSGDEQQKRDHE